jgi:membrane-associated phospholipid phosphatase
VSRARQGSVAAGAAAFAALAGLVAAGSLTSVDEWALHHAMPEAHFTGGKPTLAEALVPLLHSTWDGVVPVVTNVVTVPAAFLVATAIVGAACAALPRRTAAALALAYVAGNAIEALTKSALTRPALYAHGIHVAAYDNSFPSGHTIRTVLVAAAVTLAWPRARTWAVAWAACSVVMIELGALHVPSDIVGGLLLAGPLVVAARAAG